MSGIGYTVDATQAGNFDPGNFVKHDHVYVGFRIPDPTRAQITFKYDSAVSLSGVQIVEHVNGISKLHAFVGDDLGSLTDVGDVFGNIGDVGSFGVNGALNQFNFSGTATGRFVRIVFSQSSLNGGYAFFRMNPTVTDAAVGPGVPEPMTWALMLMGFGFAGSALRRRRRSDTLVRG